MPTGADGGANSPKQLQPLRHQFVDQEGHARNVCARPIEAGDEPQLDRINPGYKDNGDGRGRSLCRERGRRGIRYKDIDLTSDQLGGQYWQMVAVAVTKAVLDRRVLALDKARLFQPLAKGCQSCGL
jgi:hypothetical protein